MSIRALGTSHPFPIAQAVGAYPRTNWLTADLPPAGAPAGAALETVNVAADGTLTFLTLLPNSVYFAYAALGGVHTYIKFRTDRFERKAVNTAAVIAENVIMAAVPGRKIVVDGYALSAKGAVEVTWKSGANVLAGGLKFADTGGISHPAEDEAPPLETRPGEALILSTAQAIAMGGHVLLTLEPRT